MSDKVSDHTLKDINYTGCDDECEADREDEPGLSLYGSHWCRRRWQGNCLKIVSRFEGEVIVGWLRITLHQSNGETVQVSKTAQAAKGL